MGQKIGRSPQERRAAAAERRARRAEIDDPAVVMEAAATFLAVRPRSTEETRRRLTHLGYPSRLTDGVIGRLVEMGYLDDADFARAWVESRDRARPRGVTALRRELQLKGIERETIDVVLEDREQRVASADPSSASAGADDTAARHLLDRRAAALARESDPRKRRQKAYALLARHGFSPDVCQRLASTLGSEQEGSGDEIGGV